MAELKRVKDRGPEERLAWRRAMLKRKSERKRERNRLTRTRIASLKRTFRKDCESANNSDANESLRKLVSAIDKASKNGVIHKRTASRRKSRLARNLAKLSS